MLGLVFLCVSACDRPHSNSDSFAVPPKDGAVSKFASGNEAYQDLVTALNRRIDTLENDVASMREQLSRLENDVHRLSEHEELPGKK